MQRSSRILCTLNTAEEEGEWTAPFKAGSALLLSAEGMDGTEKIKAAARSVESWRCLSNIQMTGGRRVRGLMSPPRRLGQPQSCPLAALGPLGLPSLSPSQHLSLTSAEDKSHEATVSSVWLLPTARRYFNQ